MVEKKASDLFFAPFSPAKIKIDGKIMPVNKLEMTPKMVKQAALELMDEDLMEQFQKELEVDFAISEPGLGRFRVNVFHQRSNVAMVLRYITSELPTLDELGMPYVEKDIEKDPAGYREFVSKVGRGAGVPVLDYKGQVVRGYSEATIRGWAAARPTDEK